MNKNICRFLIQSIMFLISVTKVNCLNYPTRNQNNIAAMFIIEENPDKRVPSLIEENPNPNKIAQKKRRGRKFKLFDNLPVMKIQIIATNFNKPKVFREESTKDESKENNNQIEEKDNVQDESREEENDENKYDGECNIENSDEKDRLKDSDTDNKIEKDKENNIEKNDEKESLQDKIFVEENEDIEISSETKSGDGDENEEDTSEKTSEEAENNVEQDEEEDTYINEDNQKDLTKEEASDIYEKADKVQDLAMEENSNEDTNSKNQKELLEMTD
ncbi:hypothetical protein CWI37_0959p0010 [Hamiltosporidium tvaerminnensis]|uniref:Uncharacterized protein n=1 Tax=Hamiltosporidium tvaerminnensis TaxID=1176355 RepID=A0A4Q9KZV0_9MICR|nr:hypothetical protein CWI37_0959p0010 [Hamiltosporidium tvaerminnensis]